MEQSRKFIEEPMYMREWGYMPTKSKVFVYEQDNWLDFCKKRNTDPERTEGTYLPRTKSAHLKRESEFIQLNYFHEYVGHGGFCEKSIIGVKISLYEKDLKTIEDCLDEDNFDLLTIEYQRIREEFQNFLKINKDLYEGYSYWLESFLAGCHDLTNLSDKKKSTIPMKYRKMVFILDKFAKSSTPKDLIYKIFTTTYKF